MSQATVNWGDGTANEQVPVVGNVQSWSFSGKQHTYAAAGPYTITVNGLAGGVGVKQITLASAPAASGTPTTGLALTGQTLTIPKPTGLVNGDYLLALIRGQVAAPVNDITPPIGFGRLGPAYVANDANARVQGFFGKPVVDITREPASYSWQVPAAGRSVGTIIIVKGVGESPDGFFNSYPGSGVAPHKFTDTFVLPTLPVLHLFGLGGEHSANIPDTLSGTPAGMTLVQKAVTDTVQTNSRTSLFLYSAARTASPAPIADAVFTNAAVTTACAQSIALRGSVPYLFADVTAMLAKKGFGSGHRGNSVTYAEMSADAYNQSVKRGYAVLEFSVARTVDGVWFGLHDSDINRTSKLAAGTLPDVSTMTWAQVQTYQNLLGLDNVAQPYYRFDDFLAAYANTHIVMIDPKYAWLAGGQNRTEFWNLLAPYPKNHVIIKGFIDSMSLASAATSNGYSSWGYAYEADVSNPSFPTWAAAWTILGLNLEAAQSTWTTIKTYGKKVIGHIATSRPTYDMAMTKGADGVQVGATAAVPAVNAAP